MAKTLTSPMKKHLKMTTVELIAERENEVATIERCTARLETETGRSATITRGTMTGSQKAIASIDMALEQRA